VFLAAAVLLRMEELQIVRSAVLGRFGRTAAGRER
jgi:hypothetical protein